METNAAPVSTSSVALRYGLLTGLVSIIISFVINVAHLEATPAKWLASLVLVAGIVLAQRFYKLHNAGYMSYGQGMGISMLLSLVVGVLSSIFTYVYVTVIDTDIINRIMEKTRSDMESRGGISDEEIDRAMQMTTKFMTPGYMSVMVVVLSLLSGLLIGLVVSAFIKHSKPEFE